MSIIVIGFLTFVLLFGIVLRYTPKKIKRIGSLALGWFIIASILITSLSLYRHYNRTPEDIFAPEKQISTQLQGTGNIHFSQPKNMVWVEIRGASESPSSFLIEANHHSVLVDFEPGEDGTLISDPLFIDPTSLVWFHISDTLPTWSVLTFIGIETPSETINTSFPIAHADEAIVDNVTIISRSTWGADEELRFADSQVWKDIFKKDQEKTAEPQTEIAQAINARFIKIRSVADNIFKNNPSESIINDFWQKVRSLVKADRENLTKKSSQSLPYYESKITALKANVITKTLDAFYTPKDRSDTAIRTENGRPLIWPIEHATEITHIVIHHTAEEGTKTLDDAATVRGIYYYHAIGRRWGDIGYNYIIGKTGKIYEGRAGGDGVVGAHTMWNNYGTIGISLVGNFEINQPTPEQRIALDNLLVFLAKKHTLDLNTNPLSHRECLANNACLLEHYQNPVIIGHSDAGYTSCPGKNLKASLGEIRAFVLANTSQKTIVVSGEVTPKNITISPPSQSQEKNIRTRLSFPLDSVIIRPYAGSAWSLETEWQKGNLSSSSPLQFTSTNYGVSLTVGNKTFVRSFFRITGTILQISNWNRVPTWDSQNKYNDNTFRGTLEVRVENGKLLVINELPIEDYLRGLAEISNGDNPEKVKSILVSARGYATYYSQPEHRKFPWEPYDGSDNPDEFQKYLGYGYEQRSPEVSELIDATQGEVLAYSGTIIKPWYFNESDGKTLSYKEYCLLQNNNNASACSDIPYLQSVLDPGGVGHTRKGHGVGLSGIGASYLAENLNYDYREILTYYFQGVEVKKVW